MLSGQAHRPFLEEKAEVEVLADSLEKLTMLRKKMKDSLARLQERANHVEEAIEPIYNNTTENQAYVANITSLVQAIDRIYTPPDQNDLEILARGPRQVELNQYLAAVQRITASHADMHHSTFKALQPMIKDSRNRLRTANIQLETYFRDLLQSEFKPIEVLYYMTKLLKYPTLPPNVVSILANIHRLSEEITSLTTAQVKSGTDTVSTYSEERGNYLHKSLENLAVATISTSKSKVPDVLYTPGSCGIGAFAQGIEGMFLCECENIVNIFSRSACAQAYAGTARQTVRAFGRTVQELNHHVKEHMATDCYLGFEIIGIVNRMFTGEMAAKLEILPEAASLAASVRGEFLETIKPIQETAQASLVQLLKDAANKGQSFVAVPPEATSLGLGNEIASRLRALTLFMDPVRNTLCSMGDRSWTSRAAGKTGAGMSGSTTFRPMDVGADGLVLFRHYVQDVIEVFLANLRAKAQRLNTKPASLIGLFEANNVAIIDRTIRSPEVESYLEPALSEQVQKWLKGALVSYLDLWKGCSALLLDKEYTNRPGSGAGPSKDQIKQMRGNISNFNSQFKGLISQFRRYRLEKEVRTFIFQEINRMIVPLYSRLYSKYGEEPKFKKSFEYTSDEVAANVQSLA